MSDVAIRIDQLSKSYRIAHTKQGLGSFRYKTLQGDLLALPRTLWSTVRGQSNVGYETVWALKDVSCEVKQGEVLGVIGRNGAGKSTLLKILSRITEPTSGRAEIYGRIVSLLEVGTGFHPELTGRENVFLNGAVLGMRRAEIARKFDEIVDFAGVERFLDTPVKHYSSGMYVRLAFAVAAHLESEILIIDEVLAVGDAEFQKKCLGKMENVSKSQGRTVLFVSHNMGAVKNLCTRGILLEGGTKKLEGEITPVINAYTNPTASQNSFTPFQIKTLGIRVTKITLNEEVDGIVTPFKPLKIDIEMDAEHDVNDIGLQIMISHDDTNGVVFSTNTKITKDIDLQIKKGKNKIACLIGRFDLCSGRYWLGFCVDTPFVVLHYYELVVLPFDVVEVAELGQWPTLPVYGHVYLAHEWLYSK